MFSGGTDVPTLEYSSKGRADQLQAPASLSMGLFDLDKTHQGVRHVSVTGDHAGQRLDNFLLGHLKGVPRSIVYKLVRTGQVRVNGRRAKSMQKLQAGDEVRIPPVKQDAERSLPAVPGSRAAQLEDSVIYEDEHLLVVNKPAGLAVHGGSGIQLGVIEMFRELRPDARFLELAHRLDRDTSGVLVMARNRKALMRLHDAFRDRSTEKVYLAWVQGRWPRHRSVITAPLKKNTLRSGERVVRVLADGKPSETRFVPVRFEDGVTLVQAFPLTGRTHQIRVHAQFAGCPIIGDTKYGEDAVNREWAKRGLNRLCLHARKLTFPWGKGSMTFEAPWELEDWHAEA